MKLKILTQQNELFYLLIGIIPRQWVTELDMEIKRKTESIINIAFILISNVFPILISLWLESKNIPGKQFRFY